MQPLLVQLVLVLQGRGPPPPREEEEAEAALLHPEPEKGRPVLSYPQASERQRLLRSLPSGTGQGTK